MSRNSNPAHLRTASRQVLTNVTNMPIEGPLNDDSAEKHQRLLVRKAREDPSQSKLAASMSPRKPSYRAVSANDRSGSRVVSSTDQRRTSGQVRAPPSAKFFEEWIKMASDNV